MTGGTEGYPVPAFRESGRRGLSPTKAVAILIAATVTVGAVGYFVLGAIEHVGTHTVSTCSPHGPRCGGNTTASDVIGFAASEIGVGRG
jgi:flagellin-like protein